MKMLRLFAVAFSMSLRQAFAYRLNFAFDALLALAMVASFVATIALVFTRTGSLAGWSGAQMLVLLGTYAFMTGLRSAFIDPNVDGFAQRVRDGRLDPSLLQPAPSVLLATCSTHAPLGLVQSVLGLGVIGVGLQHGHLTLTMSGIAGWLLLTALGALIGWSTSVLLACLAFFAPQLSLGVLHDAAWSFGRYPVDVYARPLRLLFTYIFPMAAVTTWPARMLTTGPDLATIIFGLGITALFVAGSLVVWRAGVRRYTGATS